MLPGGFLGVDVFFVISGYLISGMILEGIRAGTFTITGFYLRRARRILPALLTMLLGCVAARAADPDARRDGALRGQLDCQRAVRAQPRAGARDGILRRATETNPLLHLWSLGVEEQFYLLWPAALLLLPVARGQGTWP